MTFAERVRADLRLAVLRLLEASGVVGLQTALLRDLLEDRGRRPSADQLATELAWLAEQGLLAVADCDDGQVARATARGIDVATGRATSPGVARPAP